MTTSMKKSTILALALTFAASPLVAVGQTESGDQSQTKTSSSESMDSADKSKMDKESAGEKSAGKQKKDASKQKKSADGASADSDIFVGAQKKGDLLSANLIGAYVNDSSGNSLGSVENVLIGKNQKVRALVIGVGGFLGIGAKSVAVDFAEFQHKRAEDGSLELVLSATRAQLQKAPAFKSLVQKKAERKAKERQQQAKQRMQQQQSGSSASSATSGSGGTGGGTTN